MELGLAQWEDVPYLREIWRACFGGPDQYLDFYYNRRFVPKDTLVARECGQPVAMLTLMNVRLNSEKGAYVYAVATLPWYQGMGLQRKLSEFALLEMRKRKSAFCCLVPAEPSLFGMYEKMGYKADFFIWRKTLNAADTPFDFRPVAFTRCGYSRFAALRRDYLAKLENPIVHPDKELRYIYQELCNFQGAVAGFAEDGRPCYAAYNVSGDQLVLREQTGGDPERAARSLMRLHRLSTAQVSAAEYFPGASRVPYGMGQWLGEGERSLSLHMQGSGYMALMLD